MKAISSNQNSAKSIPILNFTVKETTIALLMYLYCVLMLFLKYIDIKWNADIAWSYSYAHYMKNGLVPYKDFTMITPPFAAWIMSLPLYIYDSFLTWNLICLTIHTLTMYLMHLIIKRLNIPVILNAIITVLFTMNCMTTHQGYNGIQFIIILCIINICLNDTITEKKAVILGILCACSVLAKQSSGAFMLCATAICLLLFSNNRLKCFILYCISGIVTTVPFVVYLIYTNALPEAFDIWFNCTSFKILDEQKDLIIKLLFLSFMSISYMLYKGIRDKNRKYIKLCIFSAFNLIQIYPLPNITHIFYGLSILLILSAIYLCQNIRKASVIGIILICLPVSIILTEYKKDEIITKSVVGEALHLEKKKPEHLHLVNDYIYADNEHSYIFINENNTYAHLLHDNESSKKEITVYKWFDMLLEGNIGSNNAKELAENADCDYFIVSADPEQFFWQYSDELKEYIYSLPLEGYIDCDLGHAYAIYKHEKTPSSP